MGQYDIFVFGGLAAAAGYYLLVVDPTLLEKLFPPVDGNPNPQPQPEPEPEPEPEPNGNGNGNGGGNGGGGGGGGDGSYDCARACRNCWCRSYSENCSGNCSKCCGGSRIASKCNGEGVRSCSANQAYVKSMAARGFEYPYNNMRLSIA